jgi:ABC-type spermidine/putrescine transport system permease subunit I
VVEGEGGHVTTRRGFWALVALPGLIWLCLFVAVPTYALVAVATGRINDLFQPVPAWNPLHGNVGFLRKALTDAVPGGQHWPTVRNTLEYVAASLALCMVIGYPVAYHIARHARRTRTLLVVLLVLPFWVSYLMRMLAWVGLLAPDGYVNRVLSAIGVAHPPDWLGGHPYTVVAALTYGYVPFFILTLFAGLDRIDRGVLDAGRDLGASPVATFLHVTLPLSRSSLVAASAIVVLPMFGDFYTNDLISGSPRTNMLGNQINLYIRGGPQKNLGAALVTVMMVMLLSVMAYYAYATARRTDAAT